MSGSFGLREPWVATEMADVNELVPFTSIHRRENFPRLVYVNRAAILFHLSAHCQQVSNFVDVVEIGQAHLFYSASASLGLVTNVLAPRRECVLHANVRSRPGVARLDARRGNGG